MPKGKLLTQGRVEGWIEKMGVGKSEIVSRERVVSKGYAMENGRYWVVCSRAIAVD